MGGVGPGPTGPLVGEVGLGPTGPLVGGVGPGLSGVGQATIVNLQ